MTTALRALLIDAGAIVPEADQRDERGELIALRYGVVPIDTRAPIVVGPPGRRPLPPPLIVEDEIDVAHARADV